MRCPDCSNEIGNDAKFCKHCGTEVTGRIVTATASAYCRACGAAVRPNVKFWESCGVQVARARPEVVTEYVSDYIPENTSGQGAYAIVPPGVGGWNWGAFVFGWIWAVANNTWIGLLTAAPYVGFVMSVFLGVRGNEWAWRNRRWQSVEQFRETQVIWNRWGKALFVVLLALGVVLVIAMANDPALQAEIERRMRIRQEM